LLGFVVGDSVLDSIGSGGPQESEIFKNFPKLLADKDLVTFICDYGRLIIIGNARTHEIEALMDEEPTSCARCSN